MAIGVESSQPRSLAASQPRSLAALALFVAALLSSGSGLAQLAPNPSVLIPFAPITYNGPESGVGGLFMFGSFNTLPGLVGVTLNVFDGNTGNQILYPGTFPAIPPYTVGPANALTLGTMRLHNGLGPAGVDPAEDDNPQGLAGGAGGRTLHHRRHRLVPTNQDIVPWYIEGEGDPRLMASTVVKLDPSVVVIAGVQQGGVLTVDYSGSLIVSPAPVVSSVWPTLAGATAAGGALANATQYAPAPAVAQLNVLSDLAPNVLSTVGPNVPFCLAWATGTQMTGDIDPLNNGLLVTADYTVPGAPFISTVGLQSQFSAYAEKLLVWNNVTAEPSLLPQYILVPCIGGVEIYDPTLVGLGLELIKVVPAAPGKEICSNISFFGPSPYDDTPPTPYFIVLERDIGESQAPGGGVNFIVFDLLTGSVAARGPVGANGTLPGLIDSFERPPLDVVRGCNDIAVAPPERDAAGEWNPTPDFASTAWFGVWDANSAVVATPINPAPLFGGLVGVENWGLGPYTDGGLAFNAAGPFTPGTNVRYFTPTQFGTFALFTYQAAGTSDVSYPIPVGEVSTNPIFMPASPAPGQGIVNQNLITWYWDNGSIDPANPGPGSGFGVAALDVSATWRTTNPAYPGGQLIDGNDKGAYAGVPDRSQETLTERPLFGYINYPSTSVIFAQRQIGIETFGGYLTPAIPRPHYSLLSFTQTAAPTFPQPWRYQKRRHTAWNPPAMFQQLIYPAPTDPNFPYVFGLDTAITIEATQEWNILTAPQPRIDDWVSYFINWRYAPVFGALPYVQGATYWDWASPRAGQNQFGLALVDSTTSPPPTQVDAAIGPVVGYPYYSANGQTPLWVDATGASSVNPAYLGFEYRPVLRSHSNQFPIMGPGDNNAWVGIGGQQVIKYSLGVNALASSGPAATWPPSIPGVITYPLGAAGRRSIIAAHIDQVGTAAGFSPANGGGPGQFRINFLHIQADPAASAGPGYEATYVNNPNGLDWQTVLPVGEVVSTEILAFSF